MRTSSRFLAVVLLGLLVAACGHQAGVGFNYGPGGASTSVTVSGPIN